MPKQYKQFNYKYPYDVNFHTVTLRGRSVNETKKGQVRIFRADSDALGEYHRLIGYHLDKGAKIDKIV